MIVSLQPFIRFGALLFGLRSTQTRYYCGWRDRSTTTKNYIPFLEVAPVIETTRSANRPLGLTSGWDKSFDCARAFLPAIAAIPAAPIAPILIAWRREKLDIVG